MRTRFRRAVQLMLLGVLSGNMSCASDSTSPDIQSLVNSVVVNLGLSTLTVGQHVQAAAIARDVSGGALNGVTISWSSSNNSVATVTSDGMVTAVAPGLVEITAAAQGHSAKAAITVVDVPVMSVSVALSAATVMAGQPVTAVATTRDANNAVLAGRAIEWSSSNAAVATVSATGSITTVGPGTAEISAKSEGKTGSAMLTVQLAVGAVKVTLGASTVKTGASTTATAEIRDAANNVVSGRPVTWSSSDITIATIANNGTITGVTPGSVTITATSEGISGTATLSVQATVGSVTVTLGSTPLPLGATTSATAVVRDASDAILTGRPVEWSSSDQSIATVTDEGVVRGVATGSARIIATVDGVTGFASLSVGSGNPLATQIVVTTQPTNVASGVNFVPSPVVELRDASNRLVSTTNVVTVSVASGSGSLGGTVSVTAVSGIATFSNLRISGSGAHTLTFASSGMASATSTTFTVTGSLATRLTITTQPSPTASSGVVFGQQPVVQLRDASNNAIAQAGVVVVASVATGGGSLNGTTSTTTDANGVATFTNLSITGTPGDRTLSFSAAGLTSAASSTIALGAGAPVALAIVTQPSPSAQSGVPFSQQPAVQLRDANGNIVTQAGVAVSVGLASGAGTLSGTTTATTNGSGVATFSGLAITGIGPHSLEFTSAGLASVTSNTIGLGVGPASALSIATQPSSSAVSGAPFARQPVIQVRDASGNPVSQANVVVTATIASGSGTLAGTTTATTNASGVATFVGLNISGAGPHTIQFAATGLTSVTSSTITIGAAGASQLAVVTQPSASAATAAAFARQPAIQLRDASGNAVAQAGVTVAAEIATGTSGVLGGTATASTNASGLATFTNLSIAGAGDYTLRFTSSGLTSVTSSSITITVPDAVLPTITITSPDPSSGTYSTTSSSVSFSGTASDNVGVTQVTWTNAAMGTSGVASGTTAWTVNGITLKSGNNVITITARDAANNTSSAVLTVIMTPPAAGTGLVAAYGFNEASGAAVSDVSGVGNNGTMGASVARAATGKFGGALSFTGGMVTVPNSGSLNLASEMTLEAWVNPTAAGSTWRDVVYKGNDNYYLMGASDNAGRPAGGGIFGGGTSTTAAFGSGALPTNTWTHLATTYDGTSIRLYVNGSLVSSVPKTGAILTSANPLTIGGDAIYGQGFQGMIDEVRVYNRALTVSEIQTDMNAALGGGGGGGPPTDVLPPTVAFTTPASGTYATTSSTISIGGTASDNVGVTQVTWGSDRGGSGTATGTTSWSVNGIALQTGTNVLTVVARDAANNAATTTLTVTMTPPSAPAATQLSVTTYPPSIVSAGVPFNPQPVIQLRDASSNPVSQAGVVVTAAIVTGEGTLGGALTATTNASGAATFSSLAISGNPGSRVLSFTSPGLSPTVSNSISVSASSSPAGSCPNMPSGATVIDNNPWDDFPIRGTSTPHGWIDDGGASSRMSIINDPSAPYPGNHNVIAGKFPAGMSGGVGPFNIYRPFSANEQFTNLYICLYLKHDANFDNTNGNAGTKFMWPAGDQVQGALTYLDHTTANMDFVLTQQGAEDRQLFANLNSAASRLINRRGQWVRYEVLMKASSSNSTADGGLDIWIDGVQTHHYTNVRYQMSAARKWLSLSWNPTYGGGTNPVPRDQYQYMDHIMIAGTP